MPRKETYSGPISAQAQQDLVSEGIENFELPKSVVMKIAKSCVRSIPENIKLQKETVLSLVKGSTVFINYLAATAHDVAQSKQHKSISASDVLKALEMIEFPDMVNKLQGELHVYRDLSKTDKNKKGNTNGASSASASAIRKVPGASTSSSLKDKGKDKVSPGKTLSAPFISEPLDLSDSRQSEENKPLDGDIPMEIDGDHTSMIARVGNDQFESPDDVEIENRSVEDGGEDIVESGEGESEVDELEEKAALDKEMLRNDALSVEERAKDNQIIGDEA